jgi:hypothetical protein
MRYEMRGRVIDQITGDGIGGVRVEAWDKDSRLDDYFGSATTSTDGSFFIGFDTSTSARTISGFKKRRLLSAK